MILSMILTFVKVLLLILLILLTLIIIVLSVVLFSPIRYRITAKYYKKIYADVQASWIFGIITFSYKMDDEKSGYSLKCLRWNLLKGKEREEPEEIISDAAHKLGEEATSAAKQVVEERADSIGKSVEEPTHPGGERAEPDRPSDTDNKNAQDDGDTSPEDQGFMEKMNNIIEKVNHYIEQVSVLIHYPDKKLIVKLSVLCLKRLWRGLKPDELSMDGVLGFSDPSVTGIALGGISAAAGVLGIMEYVRIKGCFENQVFSLETGIKGKFTLWAILWPLTLYILSKPIWRIVGDYRRSQK